MNLANLLGFALRGGSAGAKLLFVFYLAGKASSTLLGQVAIVVTMAAVFSQIAGLEINQVIGRQLHALSITERHRLLRRQAQAGVVAYLLLLPIAILLYADLLSDYWLCTCGILVLEHFVLEAYRFNVLMLRPLYAAALLFVKNVGWVLTFMALVESGFASPSLSLVLACWCGLLVIMSVPLLWTPHTWATLKDFAAWSIWPKQSGALIWQARTFIVSAAAGVGIGAIDKLLIAEKFSAADLGVYFFFASCASIVSLIASFTIGSTVGPQCIKVYAAEGRDAYLPHLKRLKRLYFITTVSTMAVIMLPANFLLMHFGHSEYRQHIEILFLLTPSAALLVLCEPYKVNAYVERQDLTLMVGTLFHLLSVALCVSLFAIKHDIVFISVGMLVSSLLIYLYFALDAGNRIIGCFRQGFVRQ